MFEDQSRVGKYQSRAATLRMLARDTRYPDVRARLLSLAAEFERLADQVDKWETALPKQPKSWVKPRWYRNGIAVHETLRA